MKRFIGLIVMILVVGWTVCAFAKAEPGTPTRAIQDLDDKLDDYRTGPNLTEADKEYNRELKKDILHGTFEIEELARLSLQKHWLPRTYPQRTYFVDLLTELLENKAILSKEQGQKKAKTKRVYNVSYLGDKFINTKKTRSLTRTKVYVKSEDITVRLDYKLRKVKQEWKAYDVILDGASLVDNYRYQFDRIITEHNYAELISRMEKKLGEIKSENGEI